MPPDAAGTGNSFKYFRTLQNKSSECSLTDCIDMEMYLYEGTDTTKWVAANDDWCTEFGDYNVFSTIMYPCKNGVTYYLKVVSLNNDTSTYSIVMQDSYDISAIKTTVLNTEVTSDSGEDDDTPATAKTMTKDTVLHRIYTIDDPDWFTFTAP